MHTAGVGRPAPVGPPRGLQPFFELSGRETPVHQVTPRLTHPLVITGGGLLASRSPRSARSHRAR
jgi:hypothetical protein